jgi:sporulation protein YlmC with PRC-barrel domain
MVLKYMALPILGVAVAMGATAQAEDMKRPEVYKNSQSKAHAEPAEGTVKPGAELKKKEVYKNSQSSANAEPRDRSVNPDAPIKRPEVYKESQAKPHARPAPATEARMRGDTLTLTAAEADTWKMRPVRTADGKVVGHVSAITLNTNGKIAAVRVDPNEKFGETDFTVRPENVEMGKRGVHLSMDSSAVQKRTMQ